MNSNKIFQILYFLISILALVLFFVASVRMDFLIQAVWSIMFWIISKKNYLPNYQQGDPSLVLNAHQIVETVERYWDIMHLFTRKFMKLLLKRILKVDLQVIPCDLLNQFPHLTFQKIAQQRNQESLVQMSPQVILKEIEFLVQSAQKK